MMEIALSKVPNQSFSITFAKHFYDFTILETNGCMCVTISRDNILLLSNARLVAQSPVIPFRYLEDNEGNFVMSTLNNDLPYWDQFGITQSLIYLTATEVEAFRGES